MPERWRLFFAVCLPEPVLGALDDAIASLRKLAPSARFTRPGTAHVTLRFLGDTDRDRVPALEAALAPLGAPLSPFSLELFGAGTFGAHAGPRVLFARVRGEVEALSALANALDDALFSLGFGPRDRPFYPHVTLARARRPGGDPDLQKAQAALGARVFGRFEVRGFVLYQSVLQGAGPSYAKRFEVPLGAPPP